MDFESKLSFVNGLIAGAGAVLALMSYGFLQFIGGLENIGGLTTTELRVAILLGGIVSAVAIGYEFYNKKESNKSQIGQKTEKKKLEEATTEESSDEQISDE